MPYITLTRGQRALVDDADFARLSGMKWHAHYEAATGYFRACRHVPLGGSKTVEMSVDILGAKAGYIIDHRNRNTLDYRRDNLRWATRQQNSRNRIRQSSLAPGVFRNGLRFTARITIAKGIRKCLGTFKTLTEAAEMYRAATKQYFGEFSPY